MAKLSAGFVNNQYKSKTYESKRIGHMTEKDARNEYTRLAKIANKRISGLEKAGIKSPALDSLNKKGIGKFGLKNQGINTRSDLNKSYRELVNFLNAKTSSKSGMRETADQIARNFNIPMGDMSLQEYTEKTAKLFALYEELNELSKQGLLASQDKYRLMNDLNELWESGLIDGETNATELTDKITQMMNERTERENARQTQLNFNWKI